MTRFALLLALALVTTAAVVAQDSPARRVDDRIRALRQEAEQLASQSRTLLGELRALEVARDLKTTEASQAEAAAADAQGALQRATTRIEELESAQLAQLPDLEAQLVDIYKHGRRGYARLLFGARDVREFARATRAVAALTSIYQRRVTEHKQTLAALQQERATLEQQAKTLDARQTEARAARAAADQAVAARASLLARIDSRRDLAAQYVGELQVAADRLQQLASGGRGAAAVPLRPFQGALDWPVAGRVASRFGRGGGRPGGAAARNGMEIAVAQGTTVRAVHGGTVSYAEPFTGFGTLVILDHGGNDYSLYGYLAEATVQRGQTVESGADIGRVGLTPAGPAGLYFEMRIDGRSVDPLQWLKR